MSALAPARLVRPLNLLALAFAVGAGSRLAGGDPAAPAALVPVLTAAFGYARNDAVDAAADRVNRPGRPVPAGSVGPRGAHAVAWVSLAAAFALLLVTGATPVRAILFAAGAGALFLYSPWGKTWGAASPLLIAFLAALAVVWGGTMGPVPGRALSGALLAGLVTFARECAKDLEDEPGDRAAGRITWPLRSGADRVAGAMRVAAWLSVAALPLPWLRGDAGALYTASAALFAAPLLVLAATARVDGSGGARRVSWVLKAALVAGVASLWLGSA